MASLPERGWCNTKSLLKVKKSNKIEMDENSPMTENARTFN